MMEYFESSVFLRYIRKIGRCPFYHLRCGFGIFPNPHRRWSSIYLNSHTHRLIGGTTESIKIGFKYSIFGRLTEINEDASRNFFQTSKATKILLNWINNLKNGMIRLSITSNCVSSTKILRQAFFLSPLKVGGIIVITAITANLVLSVILQRQITLLGWLMHVLLLSIGISGLFCNADWLTLRNNSLILRKFWID